MSFWPFGQNVNNSNINRLLDDYFRVLHSLADEGADQTGGFSETIVAGAGGGVKVEGMQVNSQGRGSNIKGELSKEEDSTEQRRVSESQRYNTEEAASGTSSRGKGNDDPSESKPFVSTISILSTASSAVSIFVDDAGNCNAPSPPLSKKWLNSSFMDNILKESELLNELTRQNNTLLDFICFGYFYDMSGKRIEHVEYLIDQLMFCIDRINEDKPLEEDAQTEFLKNHTEINRNILKFNEQDISVPQVCGDLSMDSMPPENDSEIIPYINDNHMYSNNQSTYLNRANTISEIFALDNWLISETLVKDFAHLKKLWSVLFHKDFKAEKSPLVPIFLKVNQNLLLTRQDQFLNFIRSRTTLVDDLLLHLEIPVLMNFFLKIISTDKQESPTGIIELTYEQGLITKLLSYLDNERCSPDIQACAGDFIKALIAISTNAPLDEMSIGPNALIRRLCSEECIKCFMDAIINKRGSALTTSVSVVIELIRKNNSDYDQVNLLSTTIKTHPPSMRDPIYLGTMLKMFAASLPDLKRVLLDFEENSANNVIENQLGIEYVPLGFERFKIVELIAELLHCSNMGLMNSKKAERIVKERDEVRKHLVTQLRDALTDLSIDDNIDRERNDINEPPGTSVNNDSPVTQTTAVSDQAYEDIDESFEIPYVNNNQNMKLRQNPSIGDAFKIQLYDTQILPKIIQLFVDHPWNNFWHNVIFDIIQQIFNGRMDFSYNSFLVYSLFNNRDAGQFSTGSGIDLSDSKGRQNFVDFQITRDLILQGYKNSHNFYEKYNTNLGYMGHLVLIAEEIVKFSKVYKVELISPDIHNVLQEPDWVFYSEDALNDTRLMYSKILGGGDYLDETQDSTLNENSSMLNPVGSGNSLTMNDSQQPSYTFSTQADLHKKLKEKLIKKSREEIDVKNKENGVIILGPPPESFKSNDQQNL